MVAKQQRESIAISMQLPPGFFAGSKTPHPVLAVRSLFFAAMYTLDFHVFIRSDPSQSEEDQLA
jgi:hypothetical protein